IWFLREFRLPGLAAEVLHLREAQCVRKGDIRAAAGSGLVHPVPGARVIGPMSPPPRRPDVAACGRYRETGWARLSGHTESVVVARDPPRPPYEMNSL